MQIAQRSLEFLAILGAGVRQQRLDKIDEVVMREWFFEEMNCAEIGSFLAMSSNVTGQHDGPRIWVAGSQIVKKLRAQIGDSFGVQDEKIGLGVDDNAMGLGEGRGDVDFRGRRGFVKSRVDLFGQLKVRLEKKNAAADSGLVSGMAGRRVVHDEVGAGVCASSTHAPRLMTDACFRGNGKRFFVLYFWRRPALRPQTYSIQRWRREGAPGPV
jgi:hypothetical protein